MSTAHLSDREYKSLITTPTTGVYGRSVVSPNGYHVARFSEGTILRQVAYNNYLIVPVPAILIEVRGYSTRVSTQIIQIHNSITLPANGAVPVEWWKVNASDNFYMKPTVQSYDVRYTAGICVCNSSTGPTKTIGNLDCTFYIEYIPI